MKAAREAFMAAEWMFVLILCFACNVAFFAFNDEGSRKQRPFLSALTGIINAGLFAHLLGGADGSHSGTLQKYG